MQVLSLKTGEGKFEVSLNAVFMGRDVAVTISGGEIPHIGAVAVAIPRKSLKGDGSNSASVSVICIPGHKEDELVQTTAKRLSTAWGCHVTVTAGLHIDRASLSDIKTLNLNVETLISDLIEKTQKNEV